MGGLRGGEERGGDMRKRIGSEKKKIMGGEEWQGRCCIDGWMSRDRGDVELGEREERGVEKKRRGGR